jgi:acetyl esterase/lipase
MDLIKTVMNKNLYIIFCFLFYTISISSQNKIVVDLWPEGAPDNNGITEKEVISDDVITNISKASMTVYPSSKPNSKAIILCPGGGYHCECYTFEGHDFAGWMNSMGVTFIVLKYRLPNGGHYDVPLTDTHRAIILAREHCKEWNIDPHAVGIMGASAGGHLAATTANIFSENDRPDFQVLLYPVITMKAGRAQVDSKAFLLGNNPSNSLINQYSMELRVTNKTPRAFIVLCSDDSIVQPCNSIDYFNALLAHHVSAAMFIYPKGEHGFGFKDNFIFKRQWTGELEKWLSTF